LLAAPTSRNLHYSGVLVAAWQFRGKIAIPVMIRMAPCCLIEKISALAQKEVEGPDELPYL
jgi:hypothetical protein